MFVARFSSLATLTFRSLHGHHVTVSMERRSLVSMQTSQLRLMVGCGPLSDSEVASLDDSDEVLSDCRRISVSLSATKQLIWYLASFVTNKLALIDASAVRHSVRDVANHCLASAAGVRNIVAERNEANESNAALPPRCSSPPGDYFPFSDLQHCGHSLRTSCGVQVDPYLSRSNETRAKESCSSHCH